MTAASDERLFPFDLASFDADAVRLRRLTGARVRLTREIRARSGRVSGAELGRLYAMRGWTEFCGGRLSAALEDADRALRLDPSNAVFLVWRGAIRKAGRDWSAAAEDFSAAISLRPDAATAFFGRAEVLRNMGRGEEAQADALKLAELQPRSSAAWRFLAKHRTGPGAAALALSDLDRAVALEPASAEGHAWRGETLSRLNREAEAARSFARAIRLDPGYQLTYVWRAALRLRRGDAKRAREDLARAVRLKPRDARARALFGQTLWKLGFAEDAAKSFGRALALDRGYAWAYHQRFLLRKAQGRCGAALRDLEKAFSLDAKFGWFEAHASARLDYDGRLAKAEEELAALWKSRRDSRAAFWLEKIRTERERRRAASVPSPEAETSYDVMLGYACNVLCRFCSQELSWRRDGWLAPAAAREQVYLARRRGCRILNLLGGEVTVYPGVIELVSFARKAGFETIQFETNGIRLADRGFAAALVKAGLTRVSVSVHSATAPGHDHLVKATGAFDKLLLGIDHLNDLGVAVRAAFVLNRLNYREAEAFCRFFKTEKGIEEFQFIYPLYTGDFLNHLDEMAVPVSEVAPELEKAFAALEKLGCPTPPNIHNVPPCFFPARLSQMGDWQDVGMEVFKPDGKRYRDTPQTPLYRKVYAAKCAECRLRERCVGIDPAYLRRWGEDEIKPLPADDKHELRQA